MLAKEQLQKYCSSQSYRHVSISIITDILLLAGDLLQAQWRKKDECVFMGVYESILSNITVFYVEKFCRKADIFIAGLVCNLNVLCLEGCFLSPFTFLSYSIHSWNAQIRCSHSCLPVQ